MQDMHIWIIGELHLEFNIVKVKLFTIVVASRNYRYLLKTGKTNLLEEVNTWIQTTPECDRRQETLQKEYQEKLGTEKTGWEPRCYWGWVAELMLQTHISGSGTLAEATTDNREHLTAGVQIKTRKLERADFCFNPFKSPRMGGIVCCNRDSKKPLEHYAHCTEPV